MTRTVLVAVLAAVGLGHIGSLCAAEPAQPGAGKLLWQIGKADHNTAEFALAPKGYQKYGEDPLYIVGLSEPGRDWPYVHPGPGDPWAGSREHTFTIVFSLAALPGCGDCRLRVDLVDTQNRMPPRLAVAVNDKRVGEAAMPAGAGDDSVYGQPAKGRPHRFSVKFPASALRSGTNEITITTKSGCWVLYDWLGLEAPEGTTLAPPEKMTLVYGAVSLPTLIEKDGKLWQTVRLTLRHSGEPGDATVTIGGAAPVQVHLEPGAKTVELPVPAVDQETKAAIELKLGGKTVATRDVALRPVRKWVVYLLPHSHVDIGYTKVQTEVERDHWQYLDAAIAASKRTAGNPPGAQFKWNVEVLWAVESYLKQATPEKQKEFIEAVRKGWVGLDALYGNELTALCRPEELVRLVEFSQRLSRRCGVPIDSAMISDVPGYTWGLTTVLSAAGVKYMSIGPNGGDRIGYTLEAWADKPFWWIGPDGRSKVLVWIPERGYWRAFSGGQELLNQIQRYEAKGYPYDMIQVRYCLGDNHGPAFELCDLVKAWNAKYAYPKLVIATTSEMMREFDRRYGDKLPRAGGDFTPYWEDGAASSARETVLNRQAADTLSSAEALFAILAPRKYPAEKFWTAWRNAVLYDEHTWGAYNSISEPDKPFVLDQWKIKQAFALDAHKQAGELLAAACQEAIAANPNKIARDAFYVFNPVGWLRTDLVSIGETAAAGRYRIKGPDGAPVPSQRLSDGSLAFLATDVPGFGAKQFTLETGEPFVAGKVEVGDGSLVNGLVRLSIDPKTGAISSLRSHAVIGMVIDASSGMGLNEYLYVPGKDPAAAKRVEQVKVSVKEPGPLVATLEIAGPAPGCRKLVREVSLIDGIDEARIVNCVDKEKVRTKEGVHFAFPLAIRRGVMRMETAYAIVRPEDDQLPGACKNWFTVGRWVDVSGDRYGVTVATPDAPLVEVGAITAEIPWIRTLEPSQTFYSYVMNNYWHTNYKADQEGPTWFRYAIRPRMGPFSAVDATRFGIERSQPLVPVAATEGTPAVVESRLRIGPKGVIATAFKPTSDGKGWIVRLFNVGGTTVKASLAWSVPAPKSITLSNLAEEPGAPVGQDVEVPPFGLITLRAE